MKVTLIALFFGCMVHHSYARIGETIPQVQARLGRVGLIVHDNQEIFQKNGFTIHVIFQNGISVLEEISKDVPFRGGDPLSDLRGGLDLTDNEIDGFLEAYAASSSWTEKNAGAQKWVRSDNKVIAIYSRRRQITTVGSRLSDEDMKQENTPTLTFISFQYAEQLRKESEERKRQEEEQQKKREKKAIEGF